MHDTCAWKQLIKILLPVWLLISLTCFAYGEELLESSDFGSQNSSEKASVRSQKFKAKWKGDKFWEEAAANLTLLESKKTIEEAKEKDEGSKRSSSKSHPSSSSRRSSKGRQKSKNKSPGRRTTIHRDRERSSIKKDKEQNKEDENETEIPEETTTLSPTTRKPILNSLQKLQKMQHFSNKTKMTPHTLSKIFLAPKTPEERETLIADLSQYGQEYYLEYETDDPEPKNSTSNSTELKIKFYPKSPVNLLYLLQAYASNMQPIKLQSPIAGEAPSIPVRVPVKLNPPNSPFLFSLDLDSFFTRLAISFFYSSIAIAPLVYLLVGGLGSLGGFSIVPFTGKKRRKKRNTENENLVEQIWETLRNTKDYSDVEI